MKQQELARLFYREILKTQQNAELKDIDKVEALYRQVNLLFVEVTRDERIQFTTLFARIAYACQKYNVSKQQQFFIHTFRKQAKQLLSLRGTINEVEVYHLGLKVTMETIAALFNRAIPKEVSELLPANIQFNFSPVEVKEFKAAARVVVLEEDKAKEQLIARDEDAPSEEIRIQYNIAERNENFTPSIDALRLVFGFPVTLNLLDVEIDQEGVYRPRAFVIEPDYLVDVTAVAECFKQSGAEPLFYILKKYLPFQTSKYLMIGNIANFFLDELMTDADTTFKETFPKVFRLNPLAFSVLENSHIREIMNASQKHYVNLKRMVKQGFQEVDINPADCFLEPTFYSSLYGFQGRLDVFYNNPDNSNEAAIIELKSGKTFMPNKYGINHNHYTQTLLYDLLIKSTFGHKIDPTNYILYSGLDERNLRYAPRVKAQQMEAIQIRNQIVAIERRMCDLKLDGFNVLKSLSTAMLPNLKGFLQRDVAAFEKFYSGLGDLERKYFLAFSAFIAREHQLAKTGVEGLESVNGVASLWLNDFAEKQERFEIISHLKIAINKAKDEESLITFHKTEETQALANFRKGDITVLYPFKEAGETVLNNQIFKCTIIEVDDEKVVVRLRSRQFNNSIFEKNIHWSLERDLLDSGFNAMYRGLYSFAQSNAHKKSILLTTAAPKQPTLVPIPLPEDLTEEQKSIFQRVICAEDYFLLWGPPGTGKTSKMLRSIAQYILENTNENLLLLAYTNRAVDEICESIESIPIDNIKETYVRIGSRNATAERFRTQLFNHKIEKVTKRKDLREIIDKHRIFVATVSSIGGKTELLNLKKFDRVVIDEASQILEPMLVGLLPRFPKFVLIGDHKQLPAVVVQDKEVSKVEDEDLKAIGLSNLRNSLFERLYHRCRENGWDWAFANLSHQGRMHQDIMTFPNQEFYESRLQTLPKELKMSALQACELDCELPKAASDLEKMLCQQRMIFIPVAAETSLRNNKTNQSEADLIGNLVLSFQRIFEANNWEFNTSSVGVITPYRAQIAQIKSVLQQKNIDTNTVTIDTVERYQGGAREVILISLCVNNPSQLSSMISLSDDGVDRKLNVALTRARKHLVIVGNPEVLKYNAIYEKLLKHCSQERLSMSSS